MVCSFLKEFTFVLIILFFFIKIFIFYLIEWRSFVIF